jgi:hypothetical protein
VEGVVNDLQAPDFALLHVELEDVNAIEDAPAAVLEVPIIGEIPDGLAGPVMVDKYSEQTNSRLNRVSK